MPLPIHLGSFSPENDIVDPARFHFPGESFAASSSFSAPRAAQNSTAASQVHAQAPRAFLASNRVSPASIEQLEAIAASGSAQEKFLASTLLSHINDGTLKLGHPACQKSERAVYGNRIVIPGNSEGILVARFNVSPSQTLELVEAGIRDRFSRWPGSAKITCRPTSSEPTLPTGEPAVPPASNAHGRREVEFIMEKVDLTRGDTVAPEGVASAASSPPQRTTALSISGAEFRRNRQVAATLHARGWTCSEVAAFKNTPAHTAILLATHSNEPELLAELKRHIDTRRALGNIVGNHLFFSTSGGTDSKSSQPISENKLFSPTYHNISDWCTSYLSPNEKFSRPAGVAQIGLEMARTQLREAPRQEAWEKACAAVVNKLLNEENLTDNELKELRWGSLDNKFQRESRPMLKDLRRAATHIHQQTTSSALVFPNVPEGLTPTGYLRTVHVTHQAEMRAKQEAWEKACAPVANILLNRENLTDNQLKELTWGALDDKLQGTSKSMLRDLRRETLNIRQQTGINALVFVNVPAGITLTEHLRVICATYPSATRA